MQRSTFTILSTVPLALLVATLVGCGSSSPDEEGRVPEPATETESDVPTAEESAGDEAANQQGEATFTVGDATYTSDLQSCALSDGEDAQFHGPVRDESGAEVGYLSGEFGVLDGTAFGEARINFGATGPLESRDEFLAVGDAMSNIVLTQFSSTSWYVIGGAWDEHGTQTPSSTLSVTC